MSFRGYEPVPRSSFELRDLESDASSKYSHIPHVVWSSKLWIRSVRFARRQLILGFSVLFALLIATITLTPFLNPSYSRPPAHYTGGNPHHEKVFIASCIVDPELIRGAWGRAVLELIDAVGPENAFLSVYENDSGPDTKEALLELAQKVKCDHSIVSDHLPIESLPSVTLPSGQKRTKRITYLAEIRNRAMRPFYTAHRKFDKVLFLNDVVFAGRDAANLLFATGAEAPDFHTSYHAACAVDFINPVKFYDTFATRDLDGYGIGLPFFPWFSTAASGTSRKDVLLGTDSVRVKSCWGGMVAFGAHWFSNSTSTKQSNSLSPLAFRAEEELFWDASESCLIHADLQALAQHANASMNTPERFGTGVFMNPLVRVAYSDSAFQWLGLTRRFERLYITAHRLATWLVRIPRENPRRLEDPGDEVKHREWNYNSGDTTRESWQEDDLNSRFSDQLHEGCYREITRKAAPGGFCGSRKLLYLKQDRQPGERMWTGYPPPPLDQVCEGR